MPRHLRVDTMVRTVTAPAHPVPRPPEHDRRGAIIGAVDEWAETRAALRDAGLAGDRRDGMARQMVVDALWRLLTDPRVVPMLRRLIEEPGVALHAMGALRRSVGNAAALPDLRRVRDTHPDATVRRQATQQVR